MTRSLPKIAAVLMLIPVLVLGLVQPCTGQGTISTVAGGGIGDGGPATNARLDGPGGVFGTAEGLLLVTEVRGHRVRLIDEEGTITTLAGTGAQGFDGDGEPATGALLDAPSAVCVDAEGNLYIADTGNNRVRKVDADGIIRTVCGGGASTADSVAATGAALSRPQGVAVDMLGTIYVADTGNGRIVQIDTAGVLTTIAGLGTETGDGGPALQARLVTPIGLALDGSGGLLVTDQGDHRVRRIDPGSQGIETVAGTGGSGTAVDGLSAKAAEIGSPVAVGVGEDGQIYIAQRYANRVRRVDASGVLWTAAGSASSGFSGDGGAATDAKLWEPAGVHVSATGMLYVADRRNNRVRRVTEEGTISTYGGSGPTNVEEGTFFGDGAPGTGAAFSDTLGVAVDVSGNLYIADAGNHRIRKVDGRTGRVETVAGSGEPGYSGDGGPAVDALLKSPAGLFVDGEKNLLIVDTGNHRIRKMDAKTGVITTVAGNGKAGLLGDTGAATAAHLNAPGGVVVDRGGHLFIADTGNNRIRRVDNRTGVITTAVGSGGIGTSGGSSGDGGPATEARLNQPGGLSIDNESVLYIADTQNARIRKVDTDGTITTVGGSGTAGYSGDGASAIAARINSSTGAFPDASGNLFVADRGNHRVRVFTVGGAIQTVAGTGVAGYGGDDGPALAGGLSRPGGVAIDGSGDLYIADAGNARVRLVSGVGSPTRPEPGAFTFPQDQSPPRVVATWPVDGASNIDPVRLARNGVLVTFDQTIDDAYLRSIILEDGLPMFWPPTWDVDRTRVAFVPATQPRYGTTYTALVSQIANLSGSGADDVEIVFTTRADADEDPAGTIESVAGTGERGDGGGDGDATATSLAAPVGVAVDKDGNVYVSDSGNNRIRKVDPSGAITTVAGTGEPGDGGDGGPATEAQLNDPAGIAVDDEGNLYIADKGNSRVRKVDTSGAISTVAGDGTAGFAGDEGPASEASLDAPVDVAVDTSGNLYVSDSGNHRVRKVDAESGAISTIVGDGSRYSSGDGGAATEAGVGSLKGVFVDDAGTVYFVDNGRIRQMNLGGVVSKVAGSGNLSDPLGDGGAATDARLSAEDIVVDSYGNIFVADIGRVRLVAGDTRAITTIAGTGDPEDFAGDGGPATDAGLSAAGIALSNEGDLYVADSVNSLVRRVPGVTEPAEPPGGNGGSGDPPEEPSDFNGDGKVSFPDFLAFASRFGLAEGDAGFDSVYDLNKNGKIDFADHLLFVQAFIGG